MSSTEMKDLERQSKETSSSSSPSSDDEIGDKEEVAFIQPGKKEDTFNGLSKEEVMKFAKDPFWRKVRLVFLILFWITWLGLIVASVLIIIFTPKCPPIPKSAFWQKSSGYLLDVVNFKDTNGDGYGDLKGRFTKIFKFYQDTVQKYYHVDKIIIIYMSFKYTLT